MSVVVPVYNGMPYLPVLVESLQALDYPNLEVVFTEGGGSDASAEFLSTLTDERIRVVAMPKGTSAAENWTAAVHEASGEYIKLVCQDDLLYPQSLSKQVEDLEIHPHAVMAIATRDIVDAHGSVLFAGRGLAGINGENGSVVPGRDVIRTCYVQGTNVIGEPLAVLFQASVLKSAMPWNDSNPLMLDLSTYQKVAPQGEVVIRRETVGAFRVSTSSWSTRLASQQLQQTKEWQRAYAHQAEPSITTLEKWRAFIGRHLQTNLRRIAYTYLNVRGSLATGGGER